MIHPQPSAQGDPPPPQPQPAFRSGAVARMAGMPVATLRIWEQRYEAVRPVTAPSGHRLYSAADVERVTLLRRLTQQGHAIGQLASLDNEQLCALLRTQSAVDAPGHSGIPSRREPMRIVVVGQAMAQRLQRLSARQPLYRVPQGVAFFDSLADAVQGAQAWTGPRIDLLLWQAASLQAGAASDMRTAQDAWRAPAVAVAYRYSNAAARAELAGAGAVVALEPADDESLTRWLASLESVAALGGPDRGEGAGGMGLAARRPGAIDLLDRAISPPRFSDRFLMEFAGVSSRLACECPSHLAELILQISSFETYSGDCANRSAADAQLHGYLQHAAGAARMLFEAALERLAVAEGLPLR